MKAFLILLLRNRARESLNTRTALLSVFVLLTIVFALLAVDESTSKTQTRIVTQTYTVTTFAVGSVSSAVTITKENVMVGIYFVEECLTNSTTTTYAYATTSTQNYTTTYAYPSSLPNQSQFGVTVTTISTFSATNVTLTSSESSLPSCPVSHPMP